MFKFRKSAAEKLGNFIKNYKNDFEEYSIDAVSYTHLTLPTKA